ncbi:MAG: heavy-metal-associated domain-containing protein [Gammaproteobacteria bacterium]|nr:heavy-metal-associated domain-containing protein [Gammaproteobacteria bacterium]
MKTLPADCLIHIDETLPSERIHSIERQFAGSRGVISACVPIRTPHLMVVDYDPAVISAASLLNSVRASGLHAELVGL